MPFLHSQNMMHSLGGKLANQTLVHHAIICYFSEFTIQMHIASPTCSGAHEKDNSIRSFQKAESATGRAKVKVQVRAERLTTMSWLVWHTWWIFGQVFVCGQPLFSSCCRSLPQRVAGCTSRLSACSSSHLAQCTTQWFHDEMVPARSLQQPHIRWNLQTLVDDESCFLKWSKLSAACTEYWPESVVGKDLKAWLEQIQENHKWGHRGYFRENSRLAIRFMTRCEAYPSL